MFPILFKLGPTRLWVRIKRKWIKIYAVAVTPPHISQNILYRNTSYRLRFIEYLEHSAICPQIIKNPQIIIGERFKSGFIQTLSPPSTAKRTHRVLPSLSCLWARHSGKVKSDIVVIGVFLYKISNFNQLWQLVLLGGFHILYHHSGGGGVMEKVIK